MDAASGRIYVADGERHELGIYAADGSLITRLGGRGSDDGQFDFPAGIAIDPLSGEVLVSDQRNSRVQFFDGDGNFLACVRMRTATRCGFDFACSNLRQYDQGLTLDGLGRIYVADAFEGVVHVLARDGRRIGAIGAHGRGPGQLRQPLDVVIDANERLFVTSPANGRLEMYSLSPFASDPERVVPALVRLRPDTLQAAQPAAELGVLVEVPGHRLADLEALAANGARPVQVTAGDADRDTVPDLDARFVLADVTGPLTRTADLPVLVTASLGALQVEGRALLQVVSTTPPDEDGDGVGDDLDQCPGTVDARGLDTLGCSVADLCPCARPASGQRGRERHQQLFCVQRLVRELRAEAREEPSREARRARRSELRRTACGGSAR